MISMIEFCLFGFGIILLEVVVFVVNYVFYVKIGN